MDNEPTYPLVNLSLKFCSLIRIVAAVLPIILIVLIAWPAVSSTMIVAGVISGAVALFLMQLFIEIVAIIAETLLPR